MEREPPGWKALEERLAIPAGARVIVRYCPDELRPFFKRLGAAFDRGTIAEVTISFITSRAQIAQACKEGIALTVPGGALWIGFPSGLGPDAGWEPFAALGWRPGSPVALDATWSALRFSPSVLS